MYGFRLASSRASHISLDHKVGRRGRLVILETSDKGEQGRARESKVTPVFVLIKGIQVVPDSTGEHCRLLGDDGQVASQLGETHSSNVDIVNEYLA
jgi:ribosomal protein L24